MEKIKKSFTKTFIILLIANVIITAFECARIPLYIYLDGVLPKRGEIVTASQYLKANFDARNLWNMGINLVTYLIEMPFLCGVYSICFAKLKDEETSFGRIFYFYCSPKRILLSVAGVVCTDVIYKIFTLLYNYGGLYGSVRNEDPDSDPTITLMVMLLFTIIGIILGIVNIVSSVGLYFWKYSYASNPDDSVKGILAKSLCCTIFAVLIAFFGSGLGWIYERVVPENMLDYFYFIPNTVINWICVTIFAAVMDGGLKGLTIKIIKKAVDKSKEKGIEAAKTAAYNIGGNYVYTANTPVGADEFEEEKPFIEPYDFFIEADERFSDEKVIETEDIRGVDIIAVLDEMNLADDIKIDLAVRKKLKKMFEELSFEIGEYVTYNGGRSIENSFTEEIDEREFEVSAEITRNSDYEPFKLILRVNVLKED